MSPCITPIGSVRLYLTLITHVYKSTGYDKNFQVNDVPIDYISDINYAFMDIQPLNGVYRIVHIDLWADLQRRFTTKSVSVQPLDNPFGDNYDGSNLFGNFAQFLRYKRQGKKFNFGMVFVMARKVLTD